VYDQNAPVSDPIVPAGGRIALVSDPTVPACGRTFPVPDPSVPACDPTVPVSDPSVPACDLSVLVLDRSAPLRDPNARVFDRRVPARDHSVRPLARNPGRRVPSSAPRPAIGSVQATRNARKVPDRSGSKRTVLNNGRDLSSHMRDHRVRDPTSRARAPNQPHGRKCASGASKTETAMPRLLLNAILVLAVTGSISAANAADRRYCLQGGVWGFPGNCQFSTLQQCRASAAGTFSSCGVNPRYARSRQRSQ